jgi:hypothetical protein
MSGLGDENSRSLFRFFEPIGRLFALDGVEMIFRERFFVILQRMDGFWTHSSLGVLQEGGHRSYPGWRRAAANRKRSL